MERSSITVKDFLDKVQSVDLSLGEELKEIGIYDVVVRVMEEYTKLKCKEQREICFVQMKHWKFGQYKAKKEAILNAPEPKFN